MAATRSQLVLLTVLVALVVCAALVPARAGATEESDDTADDGTITTVLQPGWNMVGWLGGDADASELFDQVPNLERVSAWDAENQRYQRRTQNSVSRFGLRQLAPGRGLWLEISGDEPVEWTRAVSEDSMLLELRAGRNLVGWAGRDGTPIEDALARFGDSLVEASMWDASTGQYLHYHPGSESAAPLTHLDHGDALWVELTEDARWWQSGAGPPPVEIFGEHTEAERAEIRGWVDGTRALIAERWGVEAPFTSYVGDREAVAPIYQRVRGSSNVTTCGNYNNSVIFLVDGCVNGGAHAHEYFHALQFHLIGKPGKRVPGWMIEGSATYSLILYRGTVSTTQTGDERIQEARTQDEALLGRYSLLPLPDLEAYSATAKPGNFGYVLGFMAVAWLTEHAGKQSIVDFFVRLADERTWLEAFEGAFGLTVDDFYEQFAAYRAEAVTPLPHLTDDSDEPALVFEGHIAPATEEAVRSEFERVRTFFSEQLGAGTADYTIFAAAEPESIAAAHMQAFGEELRDGFCDRSSNSGLVVVINLDCHTEAPRELDAAHFKNVRRTLVPWELRPRMPAGFASYGPFWLDSPAETYVTYAYRTAAGLGRPEETRIREVARATPLVRPLNSFESGRGLGQAYWGARALGFLALELLAERAGEAALFDYYRLLTESESWEEAFEGAFGMAVDDFYETFEVYRAQVAPPLPHLTDDSDEPVLVFVGDVPSDARAAIRTEFESLQTFFDEHLGAGTADYTVFAGTAEAAITAAHERAFGEAPPDEFCSRHSSGRVAVLNLDCDKDEPADTLFRVGFDAVIEHLAPWRSLPRPPSGLGHRGPAWLVSPAQTYLEYAYQVASGRNKAQDVWNLHLTRATYNTRSLSSMEASAGFWVNYWQSMAVGFLALDLLAERFGDAALLDYYRRLPASESWEDAFEGAFGLTASDFYLAFEEHGAEIAPPFPHMADNRTAPVLVFVGDVPAETEMAVREEFDEVQEHFGETLGAGAADYTLYIGANRADLVDTYVRALGGQPPERLCDRTPAGGVAIINLDCRATAPYTLEWSHFIALREQLAPSQSLPVAPEGFGRRGPHWLRYGADQFVRHAYRVARGHEDLDTSRHRESARARHTTRLLSSTSTSEGFNVNHWDSRALGFLALELLAERAGEAALFDYYRLLPESETWEEAFEAAFGIAIDDFYEAFEVYRAQVAPPLPHLTDDSDEPVLVFVGDIPTNTEAAVRAEFDEVRKYFRQRLGAGTADYTLYIGANRADLVDTYVRALGGQPPERLCDRTPTGGVAIINLDCRATAPYTLEWSHFIALREHLAPAQSLPAMPEGFERRGPHWLRYGADQFVRHAYRVARGHEDLDTSRHRESARARHTTRLLSSTSTSEGFNVNHWDSRALGFLALELLAERAGEAALFDYYRLLPESESWEDAFESAFGMAVDDFYEAFEVYRAQVAPRSRTSPTTATLRCSCSSAISRWRLATRCVRTSTRCRRSSATG